MSRLEFSKTGKAVYISHLDLMRTMRRAFLRAGLLLRHSEGFNPHANISIALPLPLGHESLRELMDFELMEVMPAEEIVFLLNRSFPEGITAIAVTNSFRPFREIEYLCHRIELIYDNSLPVGALDTLKILFDSEDITVFKKTKKSEADFNIAPCVKIISFSLTQGSLLCDTVLTAMKPMLNPTHIVAAIEKYAPGLTPSFVRYRRIEVLDGKMQRFV